MPGGRDDEHSQELTPCARRAPCHEDLSSAERTHDLFRERPGGGRIPPGAQVAVDHDVRLIAGALAITMESIAACSGVAKSAIYRCTKVPLSSLACVPCAG
ncbi:hypothetical protein GCM10027456_76660 [Kineosporia babensis]